MRRERRGGLAWICVEEGGEESSTMREEAVTPERDGRREHRSAGRGHARRTPTDRRKEAHREGTQNRHGRAVGRGAAKRREGGQSWWSRLSFSSSPAVMVPHSQSSSLQRLHGVEKRIVRVLELAGAVMEELGNSQGPRSDAVANHCREFMTAIKLSFIIAYIHARNYAYSDWIIVVVIGLGIQTTLREEIKSACEYRPFEKCDYNARIANEICVKKLEYVIGKLDAMQQNIEQSTDDV
ncbi:hypothetical protein PR202_gb06473 [Eleusine coracana subsp. coracana]|uniref:Mediator of RNA polymerase II transcription subunit 11 n=1 Tax=Eleusine coracana subsp. coracana TaxID=191504 RepID=A0AAV5E7Y0_ELECO|nr:hypothetical protein PR202_gb06473 [Eleusine coracana subsp. coracana]